MAYSGVLSVRKFYGRIQPMFHSNFTNIKSNISTCSGAVLYSKVISQSAPSSFDKLRPSPSTGRHLFKWNVIGKKYEILTLFGIVFAGLAMLTYHCVTTIIAKDDVRYWGNKLPYEKMDLENPPTGKAVVYNQTYKVSDELKKVYAELYPENANQATKST